VIQVASVNRRMASCQVGTHVIRSVQNGSSWAVVTA